ncbi:MAG: histidine kinase N-terminal 7TM domain-containing protein [Anaerolineales bacterium]
MSWESNAYVLPLIATAAAVLVLAGLIWRRRPTPGATALTSFMFAVAAWTLGYAVELGSTNMATLMWAFKIQYFGILAVPILWFVFALQYAGRGDEVTPTDLVLLSFIPFITLVLVFTNELHGFYLEKIHIDRSGGFTAMAWEPGPWFWINTFYVYTLLATGSILLLVKMIRLRQPYRTQVLGLVLAIAAPWLGNIWYFFALDPDPRINPVPYTFAFSGLAITWSLTRFQLLRVMPIARNTLVESMPDALLVFDTHHALVDINPAGLELLGGPTASRVLGRTIEEIAPTLAPLLVEGHEAQQVALDRRVYDLSLAPLRLAGNALGHLLVLRDVTPLEEARERALSADQAKSRFLSNVSHELRTPLTSIKVYLEMLSRGKEEKRLVYLDALQRETERLEVLIEDLLDVSRLDLGMLEMNLKGVNVNLLVEILAQDRQVLFAEQGLQFEIETTEALPHVEGDPRLLEQVITNLLTNALHYTPAGGKVTLTTALVQEKERAWVTIAVSDTGLGISREEQEHLFERFFRGRASEVTQAPGTGIGLAISRDIVALHAGRLSVESELGVGSTFTIWLPA